MTSNLESPVTAQSSRSVEVVLQEVVQGTAPITGSAFFPALVKHLALALDVRNCAVTELLEDGQLQTLGFFRDGQLQPNITYNPVEGPCGSVLTENRYYCPYGIQELFLNHPVLTALEADSYVGVCLQNTEGKVLGNLIVVDSKPILDRQLHESILKIFAARAAAELERQRTTLELQRLNEELELRVEQRTADLQDTLQTLKQAQAQLVQSEKMSSLGQLMAGIAHEINNPITFITGNLYHVANYTESLFQLVQRYQRVLPHPPAEIEAAIETCDLDFSTQDLPRLLSSMKAGSDRIQELVVSFRNFSRLGESKKKTVDLHEGLNSTLVLLSHRLKLSSKRPDIQVIKHYGQLPPVECYPGLLNQVFMNVLSNAIDALDQHADQQTPQIQIYTDVIEAPNTAPSGTNGSETNGSHALIRIADNGAGMAPDMAPHLFEPFFTTKPVGQGTGLGLATSYQIVVEQHHGQLTCIPIATGGTEFTIQVPVCLAE